MSTEPGLRPAVIPPVALVSTSHATLEAIAIGAAVFALVLTLPTEAVWALVIWLGAQRPRLQALGLDVSFARAPARSRRRDSVPCPRCDASDVAGARQLRG